MSKTSYITARVEPKLKASAGKVLSRLGVSTTDAVTMFLRQVVLQRGLPFEVRLPNAETRKAIAELAAGGGERFNGTTREFFDRARARPGRQKRRA